MRKKIYKNINIKGKKIYFYYLEPGCDHCSENIPFCSYCLKGSQRCGNCSDGLLLKYKNILDEGYCIRCNLPTQFRSKGFINNKFLKNLYLINLKNL